MRKRKTQESLLASAWGAHKGRVCTCGHECAAHTHTHTCSPLRPGRRAHRQDSWLHKDDNVCLRTLKAQLRPCFSLQGGRESEGPSEPPKCPCQEQGYKLPKPSPTHTPVLFSPSRFLPGCISSGSGTPSQTAKYLSCLYTSCPRPQGRGYHAPGIRSWLILEMTRSAISCLSSSTCSPIRGIELSITCGRKRSPEGASCQGSLAAEQCIPGRWAQTLRTEVNTRWQCSPRKSLAQRFSWK